MCEMKLEFREGRNKRIKQPQKMKDKGKRMKKKDVFISEIRKKERREKFFNYYVKPGFFLVFFKEMNFF